MLQALLSSLETSGRRSHRVLRHRPRGGLRCHGRREATPNLLEFPWPGANGAGEILWWKRMELFKQRKVIFGRFGWSFKGKSIPSYDRRTFRSQTSDNMDRWKSRGGKSQRREERKREDQRRERVRRKKMQVREKLEKSQNTVFFEWFVAPAGRKVGSLKRQVRSHLARWEMNNCTPLWHEAHFEVKMHKALQLRSTFRSWDVEDVDAVVAQSTFGSQNAQSTPCSDHFSKLRCRRSARRCGAKHMSKWKCTKHTTLRTTFGSWDVAKVHAVVVHEAYFEVQKCKTHWRVRSTFGRSDVQNRVAKRTRIRDHLGKSWDVEERARRCGAKHISKSTCTNHTTFRTLLEVEMSKKCTPLWCKAHFEVQMYKTHHVQSTFGSWDVEKVYAVVARSKFRSQHVQSTTCSRHFWTFVFMFSPSNMKEALQNCLVFEHGGSLAELLPFSCCHRRKWRKPCNIASLSSLPVHRQTDRPID